VKSLPCELLPTFWSSSELQLLVGSTLAPAISSKLRSLRREYDNLCEATRTTPWFQIVQDALAFDDWLQVDAMYRSRALDFPEIGHCMVPCIDLANHAAGEATTAIYEKDGDGNAVLLLRNGKSLAKGEEVTITYGDEKGACEMLFSYGFLESERQSAETLFLSLSIPDDDPYRGAKMRFADCAPGFKLIDAEDGQVDWKGEFIWLLCVSKEDGLHFDLARRVDGEEEVHAFFGEHELMGGAQELHAILGKTDLWDVYHLRAVTILQQRVFEQMQVLYGTQEDIEATAHGEGTDVRDRCYEQAMQLRRLEMKLLNSAYEDFELQVSPYLGGQWMVWELISNRQSGLLKARWFCIISPESTITTMIRTRSRVKLKSRRTSHEPCSCTNSTNYTSQSRPEDNLSKKSTLPQNLLGGSAMERPIDRTLILQLSPTPHCASTALQSVNPGLRHLPAYRGDNAEIALQDRGR